MKVAIQGIRGSFHDIAAHEYFQDEELEMVWCNTFEDLFATMKEDDNCLALMAIENTIAGSLLHNYELLRQSGATIIGEHKLHIEHSIMCLPGEDWADIKEVNSHPVALAQCRGFLQRHPQIKVVEAEDTAGAAEKISRKKLHGHAAICHAGASSKRASKTTNTISRASSCSATPGMPTACAISTPPTKPALFSPCRMKKGRSRRCSASSRSIR